MKGCVTINGPKADQVTGEPVQLHCPQCSKAMRVAPQHVYVAVACPHCSHTLAPWHLVSPAAGRAGYPDWEGYSWRNRWLAGALGVLLGPFGVHRFYLGFNGIGLLQALLTVGSVFVLSPVVAVWAFVEGILCFCGAMRDADGLPLRG